MDSDFFHSRVTGALYGLAIGDALGKPVSGLSPFEIMSRYQTVDAFYGHSHDKPGLYGPAARDAFHVLKSIYENEKINTDDLTKAIIDKEPLLNPCFLPRIVPLSLFLSLTPIDDWTILKSCRDVVMVTQQDKQTVLPAFVIAKTIIDCIRNRKGLDNPNDIYQSDRSLLARIIDVLKQAEQKLSPQPKVFFSDRIIFTRKKLQSKTSTEEFLGINRNETFEECVAFSIFCFMKSPDSFTSVIKAASLGGNTSINAGLVGAMVGAYSGTSFFSEDFRDNVENSAKIISWSEDFANKFFKEEE